MKLIYHPKGRAGEYASFAVNLYNGCEHQCVYCYVPLVMHKTRGDFQNAHPRPGILSDLQADALYLANHRELGDSVFLCFSCDPYQPLDDYHRITRKAIEILHGYGISVTILTKAGLKAVRDFDLLTDKDQFGVTLTCLDDAESRKWEPGAVMPGSRIQSLREAHIRGIPTWASLEPVLNPQVTLDIIERTKDYVDMFKVGKLNYHPAADTIDWAKFTRDAVTLLESLGKKYYIKQDLRQYLK
jgi:DNA repair photolyase